ncbi:hypothetical protein H4R21_002693 [Coemansia helicoidea]|uniref:Uncharacterized protein n=1 Tax=Coemansia helicoidea TaxID=1286919 RepID=A0ACC1L6E4_9FUNG|nr:hypothetical protein H4R21_002693 [Coemansia helicoidea]
MKMFKGNDHLAKGLLFGDHEFALSDRGSDQSIAKELSLTTGRYRGGSAESADIGDESPGPLAALFAFTREDVAELIKRTREVSVAAGVYSQKAIMYAIDTWYDGYDFGFPGKRYSPLSVLNFLETLALGDTIAQAWDTYWVDTGNMYSVAQLPRCHREDILQLAQRLLSDRRTGAKNSSIRVVSQPGKAKCVLPPGDFMSVSIGRSTYPSGRTDLRSTDEVVTLLLHLGYLTMSPGNGVRIPNGEVRDVWNRGYNDIMSDAGSDD